MKTFISYSHQNADALRRLHTHLALLLDEGLIEAWYDHEILAGGEIDAEINKKMEEAELFLLLVSPDFFASDYCRKKEMTRALDRHNNNLAHIAPIIVEHCDWKNSPLAKLKVLPKDGKPISSWSNPEEAFAQITLEIRRIVASGASGFLVADSTKPNVAVRGKNLTRGRRYHIKRDFDEIDRKIYADDAYRVIRDYFKNEISELNSIDGIRAHFASYSDTSFGCTIINKEFNHGTAHITVHGRGEGHGFGSISFSFAENASSNTANGFFHVEATEYKMYLKAAMTFGQENNFSEPEMAAKALWDRFIENAGISAE